MSLNLVNEVGGAEVLESNCIECSDFDNSRMVQCDQCDGWAHFRCVGVGPEIEDSDWCCKLCSTTLSGLSLSDTSVGTEAKSTFPSSVDAVPNNACSSVNVEPEALNVVLVAQSAQKDTCLKLVKEDSDMSTVHSMLDDTETFAFYREKLAKFGGTDLSETVREIGQQLISDEVLKNYSYLGRRKKLRFKDYDNIAKLVIESAIEAIKRRHFEIYKKAMVQSEDEVKKLYTDVEDYFTKEYISKAETRLNRLTKRRV